MTSDTAAGPHHFDTGDGVRLAYRDLGPRTGAPVVLLHGLFSAAWSWDGLLPRLLSEGRRVVVLDQRGHGQSSRAARYAFADFEADLTALVDHLGLDRFDLIGHSLGGHVAARFAEHRPERVRRLVLEDAPPPPVAGDRYRGPGLGALPARQRALVLGMIVFRYRALRRYVDLSMARAVRREFRTRDPQWWDGLAAITAPTLIVSGGPSSHVPGRRLASVADRIPTARLVTLPVGHRVHHNAPDDYAALVLDFLR